MVGIVFRFSVGPRECVSSLVENGSYLKAFNAPREAT